MTKKQCGVVWTWWTHNCGGGVWWKLWTHPLWMWCGSFERAAVSAVSSQPLSSTLFRHLQLNSTQFWPIVLFKRGTCIHIRIYMRFSSLENWCISQKEIDHQLCAICHLKQFPNKIEWTIEWIENPNWWKWMKINENLVKMDKSGRKRMKVDECRILMWLCILFKGFIFYVIVFCLSAAFVCECKVYFV